ncbi:GAF domain-containing SpoIIE family protein phosphatase [Streptomyces sp. OspMP-M43]|uniref:PP2C family protein-serine/threonine phosphatase n=1 Tax=Streptomyces sp. OspMP-M43 TaxID=1839781 RepID=UPI00081B8699|nr:GAF domain-containing SpoIIE family protein phosphatase [Streptomyces sp. OspMP-M43]SCE57960.1 Serine phosphatase RsbU, regulator of sigma subunit [Streptomyces sp. OspMP-M43]
MCPEQEDAGAQPRHALEAERDTASATSLEVDEKVQRALDRLTLLINAAEALSSTLEVEQGLRRLCRTLIPGLADWCAVDLLDDRGRLRRLVVEHREADMTSPGLDEGLLPPVEGSEAAVAHALLGVGPVLLTDIPQPKAQDDALSARERELFERLATDTVIVAPLRARRQVLGALTLARSRREARLTQDALSLVEDLAHRVALAVDNARLHAEAQHTAERLQRSLLPELPTNGPLEVAARYQPASATARVGGDWYDAFVLPDGAMTLIIGDIAGHDLRAAVMMSQTRNMLRGIACDRKEPPGKILARLDAAHHILYPHQTLTCTYALIERLGSDEPWLMHYGAAGHPAPLLVTREGETHFLTGGRSLMIGVNPEVHRPAATESLPPHSTVLLYTDGLVERREEDLGRGLARLRQHAAALAREPLQRFCDEIVKGMATNNSDDVALIAVRVAPSRAGPAVATP